MWFLFLIAGLYVIMPVIKQIAEKAERRYLIIALCFAFIMPAVCETLPLLLSYDFLNAKLLIIVKIIQKLLGWTGYFMLGHYLSQTYIKKSIRIIIYVLGLMAVISSILIFRCFAFKNGYAINEFYDNISLTVLCESIAIFELIKNCKYKFSDKIKDYMGNISKITFGIYLVHMLVIYGVDNLWLANTSVSPCISLPVTIILVFVLSAVISYIISKIPLLNKYVV